MAPDQPDQQRRPSKRHRRSLSLSMVPQKKVIDLTGDGVNETGSSRKHGRNDQDTHVEGPSKRSKVERDSEPPMSKDKSMTPKTKRKKKRKEINHRKVPRTSSHQKLKEDVQTLERELKDSKQELKEKIKILESDLANSEQTNRATQQEYEDFKLESSENIRHLEHELNTSRESHDGTKKVLASVKEQLKLMGEHIQSTASELVEAKTFGALQSEEVRKQQLMVKAEREELEHWKARMNDPVNGLEALHQSCQRKNDELKAKDDRISDLEKRLADKTTQSARLEQAMDETKASLKTALSNQTNYHNELVKSTERLTSVEQDRDEAKAAREEAKKDAEALHRINEAHGHRTHGARTREQKTKETLKSERSEKAKLQARCMELEANLTDQKNQHNQTVTSLHQKLMASRNQSQRYNNKEPDEKIKKDFASLEARIRQFVDGCARPVLTVSDHDLKPLWPDWSPRLREFLASPLLCNLVFEAYVWNYLVARIFSPGSEIWTGELGLSLDKTLRLAGSEAQGAGYKNDLYIDYQYLRSSSSSLIHHLDRDHFLPKYFASDVEAITSTLAKLCSCDITDTMKDDAMEIFKEAREFEIQLRMLKTVYGFGTGKLVLGTVKLEELKHGFGFAYETMVDRSPKRSDKSPEHSLSVDFITCPGIYKRGNNSGTNYDTKTWLIKMGVVCNAEELLLKPGFSTPSQSRSAKAQNATHSNEVKTGGERNSSSSTARRAKKTQSTADSVKSEDDADELHNSATTSASGPSRTSSAPNSHHAAQRQPSMSSNTITRSRGLSNTNSTATGGKSSTPSTPSTRGSARRGKGRGGGNTGR